MQEFLKQELINSVSGCVDRGISIGIKQVITKLDEAIKQHLKD